MRKPLIHQLLCPAGPPHCPDRPMAGLRYITLHMTDRLAAGCGACDCARYLYGGVPFGWHYSVDASEIWQSYRDGHMCLHAGDGIDGPGNTTSLGITVCVRSGGDFASACARAAWLTAYLLMKYGLPANRVVPHGHWRRPNSLPALLSGRWGVTWAGFLSQVTAATTGATVTKQPREESYENRLETKTEQP